MSEKKKRNSGSIWGAVPGAAILVAVGLGVLAGYVNTSVITTVAEGVSNVFINLLKMVSLPIIFLSIVSTASGMESFAEIKMLGKRVVKYTLFTTVLAATIALGLFVVVDPAKVHIDVAGAAAPLAQSGSYFSYLLDIIPSSVVQPFVTHNVIAVLFLAILLSVAILTLPKENKTVLHTFFSSLYAAVMKVTSFIVRLMPIGIWAFVTLFVRDVLNGLEVRTLALYLLCVVLANIVQGVVVLPIILKARGVSPIRTFKGMLPALSVAFFSKSSSAALPMAIKCAEDNLGISRKTASFSLPLCTTINMNACAAFILITVLFVSTIHGAVYAPYELVLWVFIATIAAVGNAGVPMGCYFLSSALLASMGVPLNILGVILPFYTLIDMLESAINVWSDSCVTAVVHKSFEKAVAQQRSDGASEGEVALASG